MSFNEKCLPRTGLGPRVAVLLAAYNGLQWIDEQIESILKQRAVSVQIIISVDLSTDPTYERCIEWSQKDRRISVLSYGARYGGAGNNFFRLARDADISGFDLVALADQDDVWLEDKLETAWEKLSSGGYDVYSSNVTAFWGDGREVVVNKSQSQRLYDHFYEAAGPGCTYVFRSSVFCAVQNFIRSNFQECSKISLHDWFFYAYCRQSNFTWFIDSESRMRYRQHMNNQVGTNNNLSAFVKRLKLIDNGWYRSQVKAIAMLVAPDLADKYSSRIFIICHFTQLRRRFRDRLILLFIAIFGLF